MNVFDLPIEKQRELAALEGMEFQDWVKATKREFAGDEEFRKDLDANKGVRPKGWADEDTKRFQAKLDSATST